jgi:release factor glutamine methyltransferase
LLAAAASAGVARLDAEVLLGALLSRSRAQLLAFPELLVDALTAVMFHAALQRRALGEPLAYITGTKEFWSMSLVVSPAVLVPRPETELLVELCLDAFDAAERSVADLGTGSGAIALALARERPQWTIVATDASSDALDIATINRQRLGLERVELRHGNWTQPLGSACFDVIVSNPPYVAPGDAALTLLRHEPQAALIAAEQGFADLFTIARDARARLKPGAMLLLEHGAEQRQRLHEELVALGYARVVCHPDPAGHDRVTTAIRP